MSSQKIDFSPVAHLLTEADAAPHYSVSVKTLQDWRCRGIGPKYVKLGSGPKAPVRYRLSDLQQFIAENTVQSTSEQAVRGAA